jgi:hypothetical protein
MKDVGPANASRVATIETSHLVGEVTKPRPYRRLVVLVPCFNEALTIAAVIADFRKALPEATI